MLSLPTSAASPRMLGLETGISLSPNVFLALSPTLACDNIQALDLTPVYVEQWLVHFQLPLFFRPVVILNFSFRLKVSSLCVLWLVRIVSSHRLSKLYKKCFHSLNNLNHGSTDQPP